MFILEVSDIIGEVNEIGQTNLMAQISALNRPSSEQREKISNSLIGLPRPPSRHGNAILSSATKLSNSPVPSNLLADTKLSIASKNPAPFSKSMIEEDSAHNQTSLFSSISRGPSPLTLGFNDIIPLAVAFQEVCHACFHGTDESKCQVRLIGDLMISFPAGIVHVITKNPNASQLLFRIKNTSALESVIPNKNLIIKYGSELI